MVIEASSVAPCRTPQRVSKRAPNAHGFVFGAVLPVNEVDTRLDFVTVKRLSQTLSSIVIRDSDYKCKKARARSHLLNRLSLLFETCQMGSAKLTIQFYYCCRHHVKMRSNEFMPMITNTKMSDDVPLQRFLNPGLISQSKLQGVIITREQCRNYVCCT